jgi:hypothetical protein
VCRRKEEEGVEITHTHTKIYIKEPLFLFSVFFEGKLWQATTIRSETNCKQRPVHSVSPLSSFFSTKRNIRRRERENIAGPYNTHKYKRRAAGCCRGGKWRVERD